MSAPIELVPLKCIRCDTPVPANPDEVAWVCQQCGQGMRLEEPEGLVPQPVRYATGIPPGQKGRPFWVTSGVVRLQREVQSSFRKHNRAATKFWSAPRPFFVPAFDCDLDTLIETGVALLRNPPRLADGPAAPFEPVTLAREDVTPLIEFIVIAIEAERKDNIKTISFEIRCDEPDLWILPP